MKKLLAFFKIIFSFIRHDIWITTDDELSKAQRFSYRMVKTIVIAIRGFVQEELNIRASALTYSILFAIIPLFALVIAIAKGFGVEKLIEDSLEGTYIAQVNMVPTVMGFVERYLELTQGGLFIGIGILILFMSVMNFFKQVENAFND
ncbi:MAG TPA: YhjD/YihY/BrkB family envelope integrity protein, partial [Paludibacter sp.]|nr:YhjD/YihY/BrkB family envelope integrity protein [Paludibacter sp.]